MSETAPILELNPQIPSLGTYFSRDNPEHHLLGVLVKNIARDLSVRLLHPKYSAKETISEIIASGRERLKNAFAQTVGEEKREREYYSGKEYGTATDPLLKYIERTLGKNVDADSVQPSVPESFFVEFAQAVNNEDKTFSYLQTIHTHPELTENILPLLRRLQPIDKDGWHMNENGGEQAYDIIKSLVGDSRYVVPHSKSELLYFLAYIPTNLRYVVQDLLVNNCYGDFVQAHRRFAEKNQKPTEMHDALLDALRLYAFCNDHWQHICRYGGSSEQMNAEIAQLKLHLEDAFAKVRALAQKNPEHEATVQALIDFSQVFYKRIERVYKQYGNDELQQTDIGHGFRSHMFAPLYDALKPDSYASEMREKDGSLAAIFEDSPAQLETWKGLIERHSKHTLLTDQQTTFDVQSPDFLALAEDDKVRLFLIDIQNNDDETAGIRVAEDALRIMMQPWKNVQRPHVDDSEQKSVVVWSTSPKLVQIAEDHFTAFLQNEDPEHRIVHKDGGSTSLPIRLRIQLKSEYLYFVG